MTASDCGNTNGVCAACMAASADERPYWDGAACVSCSEVMENTGYSMQYFDKEKLKCVYYCPNEMPVPNEIGVC